MKKKSAAQFGTIPYRKTQSGEVRVLLVKSSAGRWIPPKGRAKPKDSPFTAAARETFEEAGASGKLRKKPVASYRAKKKDGKGSRKPKVLLFPLKVSRAARNWPEKRTRVRRWFSLKEARSAVSNHALKSQLADLDRLN
jgi:8-oxo-dGTP pyrophosphatase MutT (NUDIX family)